MVAAFAAENQLATIVGTKTAGRLMAASAFKVGFGYRVALPIAAYRTWQGKMLEGIGVCPDSKLLLTRKLTFEQPIRNWAPPWLLFIDT